MHISPRRVIQLVESIQKRNLALIPDEHVALRMLANSVIQATDVAVQVGSKFLGCAPGGRHLLMLSGSLSSLRKKSVIMWPNYEHPASRCDCR